MEQTGSSSSDPVCGGRGAARKGCEQRGAGMGMEEPIRCCRLLVAAADQTAWGSACQGHVLGAGWQVPRPDPARATNSKTWSVGLAAGGMQLTRRVYTLPPPPWKKKGQKGNDLKDGRIFSKPTTGEGDWGCLGQPLLQSKRHCLARIAPPPSSPAAWGACVQPRTLQLRIKWKEGGR